MFKKKCPECAEKIDRKFNYCPSCGAGLKGNSRDMGLLGADDIGHLQEDLKLPFGMEKMMNSLIKQLEKQLGDMDIDERTGMPKGFKIQIARGPMPGQMIQNKPAAKKRRVLVSPEEAERRSKLKKVDAESKVKRIGDVIVYDILAPGVGRQEDVVISELETGIEVRAYARDRCYVKIIPLKVEILGIKVGKEKISVEMRG